MHNQYWKVPWNTTGFQRLGFRLLRCGCFPCAEIRHPVLAGGLWTCFEVAHPWSPRSGGWGRRVLWAAVVGWLNKVRWGLGFVVLFQVLLGFLMVGFPIPATVPVWFPRSGGWWWWANKFCCFVFGSLSLKIYGPFHLCFLLGLSWVSLRDPLLPRSETGSMSCIYVWSAFAVCA